MHRDAQALEQALQAQGAYLGVQERIIHIDCNVHVRARALRGCAQLCGRLLKAPPERIRRSASSGCDRQQQRPGQISVAVRCSTQLYIGRRLLLGTERERRLPERQSWAWIWELWLRAVLGGNSWLPGDA